MTAEEYIGKAVCIIDKGKTYTSYVAMFNRLGVDTIHMNKGTPENGEHGIVLNSFTYWIGQDGYLSVEIGKKIFVIAYTGVVVMDNTLEQESHNTVEELFEKLVKEK